MVVSCTDLQAEHTYVLMCVYICNAHNMYIPMYVHVHMYEGNNCVHSGIV